MSLLWTPRPGLISVRGPVDEDKTDDFSAGTPAHLYPMAFPLTVVSWQTEGWSSTDTAYSMNKDPGAAGLRAWIHPISTWTGCIHWGTSGNGSRAYALRSDMPGLIDDDMTPIFLACRLPDSSGVAADSQLFCGNLWTPPKKPTTYQSQTVTTTGSGDHSSEPLTIIGKRTAAAAWIYAQRGRHWCHMIFPQKYLDDGEIFALWKNARPDTVDGCGFFFAVDGLGKPRDFSDWNTPINMNQALGTSGLRFGDENAMGRAVWDRVLVRRRTYSIPRTVVTQTRFRFRNDDGTEVTATWAEAEGADESIAPGGVRRLRLQVKADGDEASSSYKIQVRKQGTTPYKDVTVE